MPDDLYQRYQAAHRAYQAHSTSCAHCTTDSPGCPAGQRLHEPFRRLQDAYLNQLGKRRRR